MEWPSHNVDIFVTLDMTILQVKEDFRQVWLVLRVQNNTDLAFHDNSVFTW